MANKINTETKTIEVTQKNGLHLRVASELVNICKKHDANVTFTCKDCEEAEGCSILSILMLGVQKGDYVTIKADGIEAKEVINEISNFFTAGAGI
jgi:phosphotransferase system HPr (HPr) family protein